MRFLLSAVLLLLQAVISVQTELVAVPVTVTDARGHHVSGLSAENFRILEDGRPQPIAVFHHGEIPVTLGLVVDRSQSMRAKTPAFLTVVSAILQSTHLEDELFAVNFDDGVSFALPGGRPFTSDAKALTAALIATRAGGRTALYDGVAEGLRHLELGRAATRALIVVSDGGDNSSAQTYRQIVALARRSNAVIYAIGLMSAPPVEEEEDAGLLARLCKDTGGVAHFPRTAGDVMEMSTEVVRDLRDQYTLGFAPGPRTDGRAFRKIDVTVTAAGRGRLRVRTRSGYEAGGKDTP